MARPIEPFIAISCKSKLIAALVVLCFLVNGFIPRSSIAGEACPAVSEVFYGQSTLFRAISFSALPLKIVNDMFAEKSAAPSKSSRRPVKDDVRKTADTSADFSLLSYGCANMNRLAADLRSHDHIAKAACGVYEAIVRPLDEAAMRPPGQWYVFVIPVLFFFLLPRSSVGDGPALISGICMPFAQLVKTSWVFYSGGAI